MSPPICKNCAHLGSTIRACFREQYDWRICYEERAPFRFGLRLWSDRCGPEGRYFKEKVDGKGN